MHLSHHDILSESHANTDFTRQRLPSAAWPHVSGEAATLESITLSDSALAEFCERLPTRIADQPTLQMPGKSSPGRQRPKSRICLTWRWHKGQNSPAGECCGDFFEESVQHRFQQRGPRYGGRTRARRRKSRIPVVAQPSPDFQTSSCSHLSFSLVISTVPSKLIDSPCGNDFRCKISPVLIPSSRLTAGLW